MKLADIDKELARRDGVFEVALVASSAPLTAERAYVIGTRCKRTWSLQEIKISFGSKLTSAVAVARYVRKTDEWIPDIVTPRLIRSSWEDYREWRVTWRAAERVKREEAAEHVDAVDRRRNTMRARLSSFGLSSVRYRDDEVSFSYDDLNALLKALGK